MKKVQRLKSKYIALGTLVAMCFGLPAQALEISPGDYEVYPVGLNIGVVYFQQAKRSNLNVNGNEVSNDFNLDSNVALLRYIRPFRVNDTTTVDFNAILPIVDLDTSGDASGLGDANGAGDLVLGAAFKRLLDPKTRDALSLGFYANLPTGSYNSNDPLNVGENRYSLVVQAAHVKHFNEKWALDTAADVQLFGKNDEFTPGKVDLKQKPRYELQAHLSYKTAPTTNYGIGIGHVIGGETKVAGVDQDNRLKTTYLRLSASHFVNKTNQLQIQLGRDLSVENGPEEKGRINLRWAKLF